MEKLGETATSKEFPQMSRSKTTSKMWMMMTRTGRTATSSETPSRESLGLWGPVPQMYAQTTQHFNILQLEFVWKSYVSNYRLKLHWAYISGVALKKKKHPSSVPQQVSVDSNLRKVPEHPPTNSSVTQDANFSRSGIRKSFRKLGKIFGTSPKGN